MGWLVEAEVRLDLSLGSGDAAVFPSSYSILNRKVGSSRRRDLMVCVDISTKIQSFISTG